MVQTAQMNQTRALKTLFTSFYSVPKSLPRPEEGSQTPILCFPQDVNFPSLCELQLRVTRAYTETKMLIASFSRRPPAPCSRKHSCQGLQEPINEARPAQDEVDLKVTFVRAILLPEKVCKDGSLTGTVKNTSLFVSRQKF
ncbi:uncharacterized protein AAGF69_005191 isoform 2-T3 [Amazona ochrocephala]